MKRAELVLISSPGIGHLVSNVEIAKLLVDRDHRLSITVLVINLPSNPKINAHAQSLLASSATDRIRFVPLPDIPIDEEVKRPLLLNLIIENQKPHVREAVVKLTESETGPDSPRLAGFVIDMFCTTMIDVANEFGVPSYVFFTSNTGLLDLMFHLQEIYDENNGDIAEFLDSETELELPSFGNPVPVRVFPNVVFDKDGANSLLGHARRFRETRGIMVNTFSELESRAIRSFSNGRIPPVYPVGPILHLENGGQSNETQQKTDIIKWLDDQPPSSVLFLCFGSVGSFGEDQVKEIAIALEKSGVRFLWSLRQPPPKGKFALPTDYANPEDILPEGFLDRTSDIGRVIGWAPQVEVLAHQAVGGFISHCGWNSTLESLWYGVPIATWPLYAEQQMNAFEMVKEHGLAVEIKIDYRNDYKTENPILVTAEEIESGIRKLMNSDSEIRKKVKDMSEKSKKTLMDGGSSFSSLNCFISDVFENMS